MKQQELVALEIYLIEEIESLRVEREEVIKGFDTKKEMLDQKLESIREKLLSF